MREGNSEVPKMRARRNKRRERGVSSDCAAQK